jgi:hypothetical protein
MGRSTGRWGRQVMGLLEGRARFAMLAKTGLPFAYTVGCVAVLQVLQHLCVARFLLGRVQLQWSKSPWRAPALHARCAPRPVQRTQPHPARTLTAPAAHGHRSALQGSVRGGGAWRLEEARVFLATGEHDAAVHTVCRPAAEERHASVPPPLVPTQCATNTQPSLPARLATASICGTTSHLGKGYAHAPSSILRGHRRLASVYYAVPQRVCSGARWHLCRNYRDSRWPAGGAPRPSRRHTPLQTCVSKKAWGVGHARMSGAGEPQPHALARPRTDTPCVLVLRQRVVQAASRSAASSCLPWVLQGPTHNATPHLDALLALVGGGAARGAARVVDDGVGHEEAVRGVPHALRRVPFTRHVRAPAFMASVREPYTCTQRASVAVARGLGPGSPASQPPACGRPWPPS